ESGLARFVIERDGKVLAEAPGQVRNPFGRPVFEGLQYSDTPVQPLVAMRFTDATAEPGKRHDYRVIAVNTAGLKSAPSPAAVPSGKPVALFDGTDTAKWYTFLRDHGKDKDPNGAFTVRDRVLRVAGQEWGGLVTRDEYSNYELRAEYAWGTRTWPPREKTARDSGLILHSTGPDGAVGKSWLTGIQCNMLEGATGDITITGTDKRYVFQAQAEERPAGDKTGFYWK